MSARLIRLFILLSMPFPAMAIKPLFSEKQKQYAFALTKGVVGTAHVIAACYALNAFYNELKTLRLGNELVSDFKRSRSKWEAFTFGLSIPALLYMAYKFADSGFDSLKRAQEAVEENEPVKKEG